MPQVYVNSMSESDYKELLDEVLDGIVVTNSATKVLYANAAAEQILKVSHDKLARINLVDLVHPNDRSKVKKYAEILKTKKSMVTVRKLMRGDGKYIYIERRTRLLPDGYQLSVFRDITEQKEFEQRRDMFVSIASHELRDPLSSIKLYTNLLLQISRHWPNATEAADIFAKIQNQIDRQAMLIEDLLSLSRIQTGKLAFRMDWFNLKKLVDEAVFHIHSITKRVYNVSAKGNPQTLVFGDKNRIYQVLINLLSNAAKYSSPPDEIQIAVEDLKDSQRVSVKDSGVGIRKEDMGRIFERYYRVNEETTPGLGIGLFLSREIIERHAGTLNVKSTPGAGSTFTFTVSKQAQEEISES